VTWDRRRRAEVPAVWWAEIEAWLRWLRSAGSPPASIRNRTWQLRHAAERFADRGPWELSTDDLAGYLAGHRWRPETMKNARTSLRSFYKWAHATGRVSTDPAALLPAVRIPRALPRPVDDATVARALDGADDRTRLMILAAALAGLRAAEVARLGWLDVDGRGLLVRAGKGGHQRRVPLHPELAAALDAEHARRRAGTAGSGFRYTGNGEMWVFPGQSGGPLSPGVVTKTLSRVLGSATGHQLRHRFATRAYAAERDLLAVQRLLGHSKPETTARYADLPDGALERAVRSVSAG
jgi:integrase